MNCHIDTKQAFHKCTGLAVSYLPDHLSLAILFLAKFVLMDVDKDSCVGKTFHGLVAVVFNLS